MGQVDNKNRPSYDKRLPYVAREGKELRALSLQNSEAVYTHFCAELYPTAPPSTDACLKVKIDVGREGRY